MIKNYLENLKVIRFSGRAGVKEFWLFQLAMFIASFLLGFVSAIINAIFGALNMGALGLILMIFTIMIFWIYHMFASLALMVRRLHDTNKSGVYYFVSLIPMVGAILLFILMILPSDDHVNNYGPEEQF